MTKAKGMKRKSERNQYEVLMEKIKMETDVGKSAYFEDEVIICSEVADKLVKRGLDLFYLRTKNLNVKGTLISWERKKIKIRVKGKVEYIDNIDNIAELSDFAWLQKYIDDNLKVTRNMLLDAIKKLK